MPDLQIHNDADVILVIRNKSTDWILMHEEMAIIYILISTELPKRLDLS